MLRYVETKNNAYLQPLQYIKNQTNDVKELVAPARDNKTSNASSSTRHEMALRASGDSLPLRRYQTKILWMNVLRSTTSGARVRTPYAPMSTNPYFITTRFIIQYLSDYRPLLFVFSILWIELS